MSELPKESVDTPKRGRIAQVLAMCAALAGGCAATTQNADAKEPEAEVDGKPEWANGPEVFEKDGKIFAVGATDALGNMNLVRSIAQGRARALIAQYLQTDTLRFSEVSDSWISPDGQYFVLVEMPK